MIVVNYETECPDNCPGISGMPLEVNTWALCETHDQWWTVADISPDPEEGLSLVIQRTWSPPFGALVAAGIVTVESPPS